jgi:hypothetical protein
MKEQKRYIRENSAEQGLQQQERLPAKGAFVSFGASIKERLSVYPAFTCGMPDIELSAVLFISCRPAETGQP